MRNSIKKLSLVELMNWLEVSRVSFLLLECLRFFKEIIRSFPLNLSTELDFNSLFIRHFRMQKRAMTSVATIRFHILATLTTGLIGKEVNVMKNERVIERDEIAASSFYWFSKRLERICRAMVGTFILLLRKLRRDLRKFNSMFMTVLKSDFQC